jgi:hypothetical protein
LATILNSGAGGNRRTADNHKLTFAAATKTWLKTWNADPRLTHGQARLCAAIYLGFNYEYWRATGQLLSWPGWLTLEHDTTLSERSIARGFVKLERLGAIQILHGGFDPKTGQHRPNKYLAKFSSTDSVHLTRESGGPPDTGDQLHLTNPPDTGVRRLGEGLRESRLGDKKEKVGLPRKENQKETDSPSNSLSSSSKPLMTGAAASAGIPPPNGNGGSDSVWIRYDTPVWDVVERFGRRAVGKPFVRYGRVDGWWILKSDLKAIEALAAAERGVAQ